MHGFELDLGYVQLFMTYQTDFRGSPEELIRHLHATAEMDDWAVLGACTLSYDYVGSDALQGTPAGRALMDDALKFYRNNNVPIMRVPLYMMRHWKRQNSGDSWVEWPQPLRAEGFPTPLGEGEMRPLVRERNDGQGINVFVQHGQNGLEFIRDVAEYHDNPNQRVFDEILDDKQVEDLYHGYSEIAATFHYSEWLDPELRRFCPKPCTLPYPSLRRSASSNVSNSMQPPAPAPPPPSMQPCSRLKSGLAGSRVYYSNTEFL